MIKQGWIPRASRRADKVRALLEYFRVVSPEQWKLVHAEPQAAFRKSKSFEANPAALSVWLARGKQLAEDMRCAPFDKIRFQEALWEIRGLTRLPIGEAVEQLTRVCNEAG